MLVTRHFIHYNMSHLNNGFRNSLPTAKVLEIKVLLINQWMGKYISLNKKAIENHIALDKTSQPRIAIKQSS